MSSVNIDPDRPGSALLTGVLIQLERASLRADAMRRGLEAIRDSTTPHADELRDLAFEALRDAA